MLDLADRDLRAAIITMFQEMKETIFKELKESMVTMIYKIENIIKIQTLFLKRELSRNAEVEEYNY